MVGKLQPLVVPHRFLLFLFLGLALAAPAGAAAPASGWRRVEISAAGSHLWRYVPQSLDRALPAPVVLFFHGSGSSPSQYEPFVEQAAERAGCVVVMPKSSSNLGWGIGQDELIVSESLRLIREELPVDPLRISVAGHSAGGAWAYLLAYATRSGYSAVFSLAARYYPVSEVADPGYKAPIRMFYGTTDPNYIGSYSSLKQQWNRLGVPWEEDIQPGLGHGDLPLPSMEQGFLFLVSKRYPGDAAGSCVATPASLCLRGNRFRVEVAWRDFTDRTGVGTVVPLASTDSGLFWFFGPDNWELLVKVLDGCPLNGHHWVFAASTTTVEYTLTVTDTRTGQVAVYRNPLGKASPALTDTGALAGCP